MSIDNYQSQSQKYQPQKSPLYSSSIKTNAAIYTAHGLHCIRLFTKIWKYICIQKKDPNLLHDTFILQKMNVTTGTRIWKYIYMDSTVTIVIALQSCRQQQHTDRYVQVQFIAHSVTTLINCCNMCSKLINYSC